MRFGVAIFAAVCSIAEARADVLFRCPAQLSVLQQDVSAYMRGLKIPAAQVIQTVDAQSGALALTLATAPEDTRTLDFILRPEFALVTERVRLPAGNDRMRVVSTVSRKEILLALLQRGRVTEFAGDACSLEALTDHIGVRQNVVAWAEKLHLVWPNGDEARWNSKYWTRGTPNPGVPLHVAVMDVFLHQDKYIIGCYTATKLVIVQGTLDYYSRVKHDPVRTRRVEKALLADGDPLVGIEPGSMWSFDSDFDPHDLERTGKLLNLKANVAPGNFVPGDWVYLLNTDAHSNQKTGYEGSNAIYLGRNLFDDYYDDHWHSYTYYEKLNEVYQWRNGVFNRIRDAKKAKPLTQEQLASLGNTPANGGLQLDIRVVPKYF